MRLSKLFRSIIANETRSHFSSYPMPYQPAHGWCDAPQRQCKNTRRTLRELKRRTSCSAQKMPKACEIGTRNFSPPESFRRRQFKIKFSENDSLQSCLPT